MTPEFKRKQSSLKELILFLLLTEKEEKLQRAIERLFSL